MKKIYYLLLVCTLMIYSCTEKTPLQKAQDIEERMTVIEDKLSAAKENNTLTPKLEDSLNLVWDNLFERAKVAYTEYFRESINTPEGLELFTTSKWTRRLTMDQLESVLDRADDTFKATDTYRKYSERLHNMKTSKPGNPYKDFTSTDPDGNPVVLSDYVGKGKYVLLDFWASWCPPCRAEAPNLVAIYDEFKGENFEIVAYSLDQSAEAWKKGIDALGFTWPQMSNLQGWDSPAVAFYAVQSIPCILILDPDGNIIERGLTGEDLKQRISELLVGNDQ